MKRKGVTVEKFAEFSNEVRVGHGEVKIKTLKDWADYGKYFIRFFPYVWPYKDRKLQSKIVVCVAIVCLQRAINILVPYQLGKLTDQLTKDYGKQKIPWAQIAIYLGLRYLQGSSSFLGIFRNYLWTTISQYSYRSLAVLGFEHVLGLGLEFHLSQRSTDVISTLENGHTITTFVEKITFRLMPMLLDMGLAVGYFVISFDRYYASVVIAVAVVYVYASSQLSHARVSTKRELVKNSMIEYGIKSDSITSYENVMYFNAQHYEVQRYKTAISDTQAAETRFQSSFRIVNVVQNSIFTAGLLFSATYSAYEISRGRANVGSFVSMLAYMTQLQHPLDQFTSFLRSTQDNLINAEKMINMLELKPSVTEKVGATALQVSHGKISFNNVSFKYDKSHHVNAVDDVSFTAAPGSTVAFVGESGGGKSTLFRLLFRFYDVNDGSISIDDQDIRHVTLKSLANNIGVVPQECVLFNDTIMFNLRYANRDATDSQIFAAAKAAAIHEKILRFPDGYDTVVGERGLRLSGGEKQRISIARAILKNPPILLLDEATAMLDVESERHIQAALHELSRSRTTLVIAHRLSTIISADKIVVIHAGKIIEQGTHEELLRAKGRYYIMWQKQVSHMVETDSAEDLVAENEEAQHEITRPPVRERKLKVELDITKKKKSRGHSVLVNDLDIVNSKSP
ncbi:P-loop containing nucleoside triphosphate hydrolase protein [Lipomyces japonicus]|uniref:P-loop containing nucleoside triphosphate hydrolase protein n=1 Tax=Lipomyces japonicus TaxID=56871 RepID=UPI0034CE1EE1